MIRSHRHRYVLAVLLLSLGFSLPAATSTLKDQQPTVTVRVEALPEGGKRVIAHYQIPPGLHQSLQPGYFGLEFPGLAPGWTAGPTAYPAGGEILLGLPSWTGEFEISRDLLPAAGVAPPPPYSVTALWQVCFDNGICSPPGEAVIPLPGGFDWSLVLWLAFLGGLTLNVMPCVLPVLALKVLAKPSRVAAWATAAGVLATLLALGGLTLALQTAGKAVGWGFQFQSPWFSLLLIVVLVALALELWGVWTLPSLRFSRSGKPPSSDNLARDNPVAAFGNGVLIVALSTPCTAPFLGTALGLTLGAPPLALLAVFGLIGVGLALPSLVFSLVPTLTRWLPRPGAWTRWVSRLGGAALLATAVWLGTVAAGQLDLTPPAPPPAGWQAFEPAAVREAQAAGRPVVVEFTATWCLTCQVNEAGALKGEAFRQAVKDLNVASFWGDYTKPDPRIDAWLAEYGRAGVPFTLVLVPGKTPRVLPELLTTDVLVGALTPD